MAVTTETSRTALGATVNAVVTITGDPDRKVRAAKAQLVRTALHRYTDIDVVMGHGSHDTLLHEEVVVSEAPITFSDGRVVPGQHAVSLQVPEDGLPSASDQVKWSVKAIIDRRHGADVKAEAPIEVLAGPERFASEATSETRYKGERCIDLELSTRTLRPGESITGNVVLRPTRPMTVTKVAITFALTTPTKKGLEGNAVSPQILFQESLDLEPSETRNFPFELTMPDDAPPTVRGGMTTPPCHSIGTWERKPRLFFRRTASPVLRVSSTSGSTCTTPTWLRPLPDIFGPDDLHRGVPGPSLVALKLAPQPLHDRLSRGTIVCRRDRTGSVGQHQYS